ncbi:uncharacterized protein BN648_00327 [Clostridium sp. CAG:411]|nr:uncharacterized protein BN648_00327 [Clostridium sp. CAG:411]
MQLQQFTLHMGKEEIVIEIKRSKRKSMAIEITQGKVLAKVPFFATDMQIKEFLIRYQSWIKQKVIKTRESTREPDYKIPVFSNIAAAERKKIKDAFQKKAEFYAKRMQVEFCKITIRNQKTRWGSCSSKKNLNFNYKLYFLPEEWMDYVVVHELAHLVYMNHGSEFWHLVEKHCPAYAQYRQELNRVVILEE